MNMQVGAAIEVKNLTEAGQIEGYGSTFGNVDQGYDVVEKGAFTESLAERGLPKMLWGHNMYEPPIGKWDEAKEDDNGLFVRGQINMEMQRGREVHSALKMGTLDGLSIGFMIKESDVAESGIRFIKEADLFEVSVVTFPMNERATVTGVKSIADDITERQFEGILRDAGFSKRQAMSIIARGYSGLMWDADSELADIAREAAHLRKLIRG